MDSSGEKTLALRTCRTREPDVLGARAENIATGNIKLFNDLVHFVTVACKDPTGSERKVTIYRFVRSEAVTRGLLVSGSSG